MFKKNLNIWLFSYIRQCLKPKRTALEKTTHVMFCFVDHFEPTWNKADHTMQIDRVKKWITDYPKLASKHKDADGKFPKHTFFYPEEQYDAEFLDELAKLCNQGFGEVEVHLHHDNDTSDNLKNKLEKFKANLKSHGLLSHDDTGALKYAFIHGNWALDNSRADGKYCGVNNELQVLNESGCYADFTLPSAPSDTQTKKINSIYYLLI